MHEYQNSNSEIQSVFSEMQTAFQKEKYPSIKKRKGQLKRLEKSLLSNRNDIRSAIWNDLKKPHSETDISELYVCLSEIRHTRRNLKNWASKEYVDNPISLWGMKSWMHPEPKGVVLVIGAWNFPLLLSLGPVISAIAAGCKVILKPSEQTKHTSEVILKIIKEAFDKTDVDLVAGGVETSKELLNRPFNHVFFTGSPQVGKLIMAAAAKNLTSVTLELGGKSPAIVDETADIKNAAQKIVWGKFMNAGQVCVASDYVLVHENVKSDLIAELKSSIEKMYPQKEGQDRMTCIVNDRHYNQLKGKLKTSMEEGAIVIQGGSFNDSERSIDPTLVDNVDLNCLLMKEEIFGPILPILSYKSFDDMVEIISSFEIPLTFYIFSKSRKNTQRIISNTQSGSAAINMTTAPFFHSELGFGGQNNSGIGKGHGKYGFLEFSNQRSFVKQRIKLTPSLIGQPPYTPFKQKVFDILVKWF